MNIIRTLAIRFGLATAPTVGSIMSGFTKAIDQLEDLGNEAEMRAEAAEEAIMAAQKNRVDATIEKINARATATKLANFIS
jgi:hypothetical protein